MMPLRVRTTACWLRALCMCLAGASAEAAPVADYTPEVAAEMAGNAAPAHWLQRMNAALINTNYDGVFTYLRGTQMSSLRIVHAVIDGIQHERLIHLDGAPREIVRVGAEVTCVLLPGDELVGLTDSLPAGPLAATFARDFSAVSSQYRLRLGSVDRIAGQSARLLTIAPRDAARFGYRLWLDETTGLLLKSELTDVNGRALEVFQFVQIRLGMSIAVREFALPANVRQVVSHMKVDRQGAARPPSTWTVGWLPAGFAMAASDVRRAPASARALDTLMYGDGLAALSVFIEDAGGTPRQTAVPHVMHEGGTVAVSSQMPDRAGHLRLVTVVGEVPDATATRVLRSVHETGAEAR